MKETKEKSDKKYKKRIKLLLELKLIGGNVIKAINTWAEVEGEIVAWTIAKANRETVWKETV